MEYCEVGDLHKGYFLPNRKYKFPQTELLKIVHGIASGLQVAHSKEILHRDLKAGNVLLTKDGVIKICDFGLAKDLNEHLEGHSLTKELGTHGYKAPEILARKAYGKPADIWSLGCIVHLICTKMKWF